MTKSVRSLRVVTGDESLLASARAAARALGLECRAAANARELLAQPPGAGDVILIDGRLAGENAYEACRRLTGKTRCLTYVVVEANNSFASAIARFCGATGTLELPLTGSALRAALESSMPERERPEERREQGRASEAPAALFADLTGARDDGIVAAVTDSETGLFNYAFLGFKLDEEFKRAKRFGQPLACVMLGFEGQASVDVLRELAGVFLCASRDTDVLGRFDESSFLFLLPGTGQDGAQVMARRVEELASERGLRDLVGDPLSIAVGIASAPHPDVARKEDLFARARAAFVAATAEGGGVVTSA
jgi:diguanylate cyclase (GGDEF)-like protein